MRTEFSIFNKKPSTDHPSLGGGSSWIHFIPILSGLLCKEFFEILLIKV